MNTCQISECVKPVLARGWCNKHYTAWSRTGDPLGTKPRVGNLTSGSARSRWTGDAASYNAVHFRKVKQDGKAKDHSCQFCRKPASSWAYDHSDPNECTGPNARGREVPYSTDLSHYIPLCNACHTRLDSRLLEVV